MSGGKDVMTSVRLPQEMFERLQFLAGVGDDSLSEIIRQALAREIERREDDQDLRLRLQERIERDTEILRRLGGDG